MKKKKMYFKDCLKYLTNDEFAKFIINLAITPDDLDYFVKSEFDDFHHFIASSFIWSKSNEGEDYWHKISQRTQKIK